jgi:alpha-tubulin suppressor-like RCC1 family protein
MVAALPACSSKACDEETLCLPYVGPGSGGSLTTVGGMGGTASGIGGAGGTSSGMGGSPTGVAGMGGMGTGGIGGTAAGMGGSQAAQLKQGTGGAGGVGGAMGSGGAMTSGGGSNVPMSPCARGVRAASSHTCAANGDGSLWCWGGGSLGQLGYGVARSSPVPVRVTGISDAVLWDSFSRHNCAVVGDGSLLCWGDNSTRQLGDAGADRSLVPVQRTNLEGVVDVAVGNQVGCAADDFCGYSCVVMGDGLVRCWGAGESGALGTGNTANTHLPVQVVGVGTEDPPLMAVGVDAVGRHACALIEDGTVRCWGENDSGQLGDGTNVSQKVAVVSTLVEAAAAIAVGERHSCALTEQGLVSCWGAGELGQLGAGVLQSFSLQPVPVLGLLDVVQIDSGGDHSCARLMDGTVWCWGGNEKGQLGDGSFGSDMWAAQPVQVIGLAGAQDISLGPTHSCALLRDDSVWCWGGNGQGQLGNGTENDNPRPMKVRALFPERK